MRVFLYSGLSLFFLCFDACPDGCPDKDHRQITKSDLNEVIGDRHLGHGNQNQKIKSNVFYKPDDSGICKNCECGFRL